jgi:hypothetical protein
MSLRAERSWLMVKEQDGVKDAVHLVGLYAHIILCCAEDVLERSQIHWDLGSMSR